MKTKIPPLHPTGPDDEFKPVVPGMRKAANKDKPVEPPPPPDLFTRATAAATHVFMKTNVQPRIGIVLGSGLGGVAAAVEQPTVIPYAELPHFPRSTVEGHAGQLIVGHIAGASVAVLQGRVHLYEGRPLADVTFPTRVLGLLGCRTLVITNAAGAINPDYHPGELVAIADHINFTGLNAALGPNEPRFAFGPNSGQRFFDMTHAYSPALRKLAQEEAARQGLTLREGVYLADLGPSYETPAEIRAFRALGADLVGMSTVHEVIIARHMGLEVLGLSLVTNMAAGIPQSPEAREAEPINHEEVMQMGNRVQQQLTSLLTAILPQICKAQG